MKCANCKNNALFEYKVTLEKSVFYCNSHLPKFLDARKRAGLLTITDSFSDAKKEAVEILSPELVVEEPVVEEPKPKKKATKKKAE